MTEMQEKFRHLISLLDDEDELTAVSVIAALLENESELGELPAELQESDDPLLRRRAHQLQAAMVFRRWRREFRANIVAGDPDFFSGLVGLHLLWFDRDSRPVVEAALGDFIARCRQRQLNSLEDMAAAMRRMGMLCCKESIAAPELYCAGVVIDECAGAGSLLMGLLHDIAGKKEFQVVTEMGEFGIWDGQDGLLLGQDEWRVEKAPAPEQMEFWKPGALLQNCCNMLFSAAVSSDSHRYVLTIAQALTGEGGEEILARLPYPYGDSKN